MSPVSRGVPSPVDVRPAARRVPLHLAVLLLLVALPSASQVRYLAFGDSITEGAGDAASQGEAAGYPPRLELLLEQAGVDAVVENHGRGGETTAAGLTRIDEVLEGGGDVLLLMEGTNDISRRISEETIRFNLSEMARKASEEGLEVVYATVVPRLPTANVDGNNLATARLAGEVRDQAWSEGRQLVDPFEIFSTTPDVFERLYVGGTDRLHPNSEGYDVMAEAFADVLLGVDAVSPVTGLVRPRDGARDVSPDETIRFNLYDFGDGIDLASPRVLVDGMEVPAEIEGDARRLEISWEPTLPLAGIVTVVATARDLAFPANELDRIVSEFSVQGSDALPGDLDNNGRVDGADLVAFALRFGSQRGDLRYRAFADLNGDDLVDGEDLAILASNFGVSI